MSQVKSGDLVRIHYTGRIAGGDVFDSSVGREPLEFTAGSEELIQGVSRAVLGMEEGEKKTVTVPPEQGYGERLASLIVRVPRSALPPEVKVGDQLISRDQQIVRVTALSDDSAEIDGNHPLAGETLVFDIELVSVEQS